MGIPIRWNVDGKMLPYAALIYEKLNNLENKGASYKIVVIFRFNNGYPTIENKVVV